MVLRTPSKFTALLLACALQAADTVVIITRHAEKGGQSSHARLSEQGHRTAQALAAQVAPLAPKALFATEYERTQQTLAPLAERLKLPIQLRPRGVERALAKEIQVNHEGQTVVVCLHSDTMIELVAAFGCESPVSEENRFRRLWTITLPEDGSAPRLVITELQNVPER